MAMTKSGVQLGAGAIISEQTLPPPHQRAAIPELRVPASSGYGRAFLAETGIGHIGMTGADLPSTSFSRIL